MKLSKEIREELINSDSFEAQAYKYFLFVNHLSNSILNMQYQNFADLIKQEDEGRFMNSQMTSIFYKLDSEFSEASATDSLWVFDEIDSYELAEIPSDELMNDYMKLLESNRLCIELMFKKEN